VIALLSGSDNPILPETNEPSATGTILFAIAVVALLVAVAVAVAVLLRKRGRQRKDQP
jgi:hypothetical protein